MCCLVSGSGSVRQLHSCSPLPMEMAIKWAEGERERERGRKHYTGVEWADGIGCTERGREGDNLHPALFCSDLMWLTT